MAFNTPTPQPLVLSLSKDRPFFMPHTQSQKQERPFDKLRANGIWLE